MGGGGAALVAGLLYTATYSPAYAGGDSKAVQTTGTAASEPGQATKLSGEELYTINCSRCHPQRYPREWTPSQWKTLMLHMRVRANLPADTAREILKYMQDQSGN
jgi:hypothetical protein